MLWDMSDFSLNTHSVDYEYAGFNYRGYDIANHFCEWMVS